MSVTTENPTESKTWGFMVVGKISVGLVEGFISVNISDIATREIE